MVKSCYKLFSHNYTIWIVAMVKWKGDILLARTWNVDGFIFGWLIVDFGYRRWCFFGMVRMSLLGSIDDGASLEGQDISRLPLSLNAVAKWRKKTEEDVLMWRQNVLDRCCLKGFVFILKCQQFVRFRVLLRCRKQEVFPSVSHIELDTFVCLFWIK